MFSDSGPTLERSTAVMWTNTSFPPSSGVMKPKPFDWLKNFTVPFCRMRGLLSPRWKVHSVRAGRHADASDAKAGLVRGPGRRGAQENDDPSAQFISGQSQQSRPGPIGRPELPGSIDDCRALRKAKAPGKRASAVLMPSAYHPGPWP